MNSKGFTQKSYYHPACFEIIRSISLQGIIFQFFMPNRFLWSIMLQAWHHICWGVAPMFLMVETCWDLCMSSSAGGSWAAPACFSQYMYLHIFLVGKGSTLPRKKSRKTIEKYRLQQGWVARVEISRLDKSLRRLWLALVPFGIKCQLSTFTKYKRTILEIHCRAVFSLCFFYSSACNLFRAATKARRTMRCEYDSNTMQWQKGKISSLCCLFTSPHKLYHWHIKTIFIKVFFWSSSAAKRLHSL